MNAPNPLRRTRVSQWQVDSGLQYDLFEPRMLLAGDVSVSIETGRLLVLGDALANQVRIVGTPDGNAVVTGLDGTTINGAATAFNAGQRLSGVEVQMNGGDDHVQMHGLVLAANLVVQGNDGNDVFEITDSLVRHFSANMGSGNDVLQLDNLFAFFSSRMVMEQGNDIVSITAHAALLHIEVLAGDGDDVLAVRDMGMGKQLLIDMGNGNDQVLLAGETFSGRKSGIRLGGGNDFLAILPGQTSQQSRFEKSLTIDGGTGNDQVVLDGRVQIGKRSRIDGNVGTDGLERGGSVIDRPLIGGFESGQVAGVSSTLDAIFAKLLAADIDASVFGGPELVRELALTVGTGELLFVENGTPVSIGENLVVSGPTDAAITSATVAIGAFSAGNDLLQFTNTANITGTFDAVTGILSLVGTGNLAAWQSALHSVRFSNTSESPDTAARSLTITVLTATETASVTRAIGVVGTPDSPVLTGIADNQTFDIDDDSLVRPLPVAPGLVLTDSDTEQFDLARVTVTIGSGRLAGDVLGFDSIVGVTGSYLPSTGVLSFSGSVGIDVLEDLLRSVTFDNENARAGLGNRTITFFVGDGDLVATQDVSVHVVATQSVGISTTGSPLEFTETDPATPVDPDVSVTPGTVAGSENATSATVRFLSGYVIGQDLLEFDPVIGIAGTFNASTGVLSFTGTATIAEYEALLRSVRYANTATGSGLVVGDRTIEFAVVSNGVQAAASRTVQVSAASQERLIQNFLTANSLTSQQTPSGLHVIIEQPGNGTFPTSTDSVRVNYRGFLLDGTNFENNDNVNFSLAGVIAGWRQGIPFFSEGGSGQLIIPSALAYGAAGSPPNIPPNAILRFEIDLLEVVTAGPPILDVCIDDHSQALTHFHASLSIVINGTPAVIESDIGVNDSVCPGLRGIHTHDSTGTLHVETPSPMEAPLGAFFQIWGRTFNSGQIFDNVANADKEVVMFVNGVLNTQFENYLLQDDDVIVIEYRDRV